MTGFFVFVAVAAIAWFVIGFNAGHKNTTRIRFKAYESREDAIGDEHDLCSDGRFDQEIVGEASYQKEIGLIVSKLQQGSNIVQATLELEDNNPHDNKAVAVKIGGLTVGYLAKDVALAYRKLAAENNLPRKATCPAMIQGGDPRANYGIWLGIPEI